MRVRVWESTDGGLWRVAVGVTLDSHATRGCVCTRSVPLRASITFPGRRHVAILERRRPPPKEKRGERLLLVSLTHTHTAEL